MTPTPTTDSAVSPVRELKPRSEMSRPELYAMIDDLQKTVATVAERIRDGSLSRRSFDTADGVCETCDGTGNEGLNSICRDCDEIASRTPNTETVVKALDAARDLIDAWCVRYVDGLPPSTARDKLVTDILALASPPSPAEVTDAEPVAWLASNASDGVNDITIDAYMAGVWEEDGFTVTPLVPSSLCERLAAALTVAAGRLTWASNTHPDEAKSALILEWAREATASLQLNKKG